MPIPIRTISAAMAGEGAVERFQLSLRTLGQLLTYEGPKPGRKLLIWTGPGWPMLAGAHFGSSEGDQHLHWGSIVSFSTELREARTTLYNVDSPNDEASVSSGVFYKNFLKPVTSPKDADAGNLALPVLTVQSGGQVLNSSNDLAAELARCIDDARAYYTLVLQIPLSETVDEYHSLAATVARSGLTVRTNTGYYNQPYAGMAPPESPSASPAATLRTEVRLVVADVVVLDRHGSPVKGLKSGDFQLKEDGVPQKITSAEEHSPEEHGPTPAVEPPAPSADGVIIASNKPLNRPIVWNVLLVDTFNTPKEDLAAIRRQLQQFVKQMPPDQPVALVAMSSQIKVLTSFQDGAGAVSQYLDKNGFGPASTSTPANIYAKQEELEMNPSPEMLASKAQVDVEQQSQRAQTTLDNFSAVAKWLNNYPGRKNVFWLSSGFPLQGQPFGVLGYTQMTPTGPAPTSGQTIPMQQTTDKQLQLARVAIYPIDVRGVAPPNIDGETSADTTGNFLTMGKYGDQSINVKKDDQLEAAQQTEMRSIAQATGGVASFNNDIARTLHDDFNRGASYYTISYTPSNPAWNGAYRKINLTLEPDLPGDQLIYRQGYYAKDPQPEPAPTADQFKMAMQHGAPAATAVLFSAKVSKASGAANVEYAIESRTIQYSPDPSGKLVANIDCAILEYDAAGKVIEDIAHPPHQRRKPRAARRPECRHSASQTKHRSQAKSNLSRPRSARPDHRPLRQPRSHPRNPLTHLTEPAFSQSPRNDGCPA